MQRYKEMCKKPNLCPYFFSMDGGIDVEHGECSVVNTKGIFASGNALQSLQRIDEDYCYFCPVA